uniref:Immunoglobulin superfamily member 9 n=1 Tax=Anser brachyrhynchus TaxID=132585 RepID=A0A8B9IA99_9AVES
MRWWLRAAFLSLLAGTGAEGSGPSGAVVGRVGDSAVLGCDLLGARQSRPPLYVIEWVRVGFVLPIFIKFGLYSPRVDPEYLGRVRIEEGASLRIDLLRAEDQGWYECRVLFLDRPSADADFQNGTWIHLTVNAPPTFLETPPAFVEVRDREALSLTCTAVGNPQPVVIWKRRCPPVGLGPRWPPVTLQVRNGTLSIAVVERASAGTYTCHASSKEGTITHTTRVLVQGPPVIVVPPQNVTVNISQDAFLACQAEAYPGNLTYTWFQGSSNVFHLSHLQARVRILVDGSLLLQRATPDDAGKYTCVASNGLWKPPSASAFVTVLYPAQVTTMLPETHLPKGMRGVIRCPTRANPPLLSVSWTRDGRPLELGKLPGWSARPDGSIVIATGNDDVLGVYTCTPYNSYGTAGASRPTRVLLKDPPAFTVRPKEEYFQEVGRELVIPCSAHGDPPPTITWGKVGSAGQGGAQVDGNGSLVFRPLVKEQHGRWECTATNPVASVSTATSVHVLGTSPHAVTNVSVLPLLLAANISWEPGFDGGYFQRFSVWYTPLAKHPPRAHHDWVSLSVPAGAQHLLVENLQPDTSYQFSVLAQNKLGSGPFSQIVTSVPRGKSTVPLAPRHAPPAPRCAPPPPHPHPSAGLGQGPGAGPGSGHPWVLCFPLRGLVSKESKQGAAGAGLPSPAGHGTTRGMPDVSPPNYGGRPKEPAPGSRSRSPFPSSPSHGAGSPAGAAKLKLQPSPCPSLRRALLWGEKAGTSLGLSIAGAGSGYAVYESHVGEHVPLERIRRGPDGRFVVETAETETPAGRRRGRYFGYGSSSPVAEAAALCIVDVSPVASAATLPYSPGPPSYLSLPFFKEMCVDGDWPPPEEPPQPPAPPQHPGGGPDCTDPCAKAAAPPAATLLQPPKLPLGPAKASLPGPPAWPAPPEPPHRGPPCSRTEAGDVAPPEKLPRGSLTSQSSGRGSASFLRPPSLAPSLGGPGPGTPPGDGGSWQEGKVSTERDTSVDESYEWDAEVALASDLLAALQLYRAGAPPRPLSTIALRDLERRRERTPRARAPGHAPTVPPPQHGDPP